MSHARPSLLIGIDHVQLAAPKGCEVDARRFFGTLLGLEEIEKPKPLRSRGGCWFRIGQRQLHIGVEAAFAAAKKAHPAFATGNIALVAERLMAAEVPIEWDDSVVGLRRFYVEDPWGNRIEITQPTGVL